MIKYRVEPGQPTGRTQGIMLSPDRASPEMASPKTTQTSAFALATAHDLRDQDKIPLPFPAVKLPAYRLGGW
jgi:hypothetical protein